MTQDKNRKDIGIGDEISVHGRIVGIKPSIAGAPSGSDDLLAIDLIHVPKDWGGNALWQLFVPAPAAILQRKAKP